MPHARTSRLVRIVRWSRLFAHLGTAFLLLRTVYPRAERRRRLALNAWWSGKLLRLLAIEASIEGTPYREGAALIAANHVSWIDIFAVASVTPTRFIAKSEIRDWPVAGWIAERSGTIFIRRARRHDTARINELVHAAIAEGDSVGLFPEGTTTEGDTLLKFHSSLFEPAVANAARVQPVAIRYEYADGSLCRAMGFVGELTFAQSLGLVIRQKRVVARIRFAEVIECSGMTRHEVAETAEARVASLLGLPKPDRLRRKPPRPGGELQ
jgi:1-acyl-sn-glycerol-3-phosphate acyltransferase